MTGRYKINTSVKKPGGHLGEKIRCPKCGVVITEGEVVHITIRCRKCRNWVSVILPEHHAVVDTRDNID